MMDIRHLNECINKAVCFLGKARVAKELLKVIRFADIAGSKESAAVQRSSLDLTHALADLRKKKGKE